MAEETEKKRPILRLKSNPASAAEVKEKAAADAFREKNKDVLARLRKEDPFQKSQEFIDEFRKWDKRVQDDHDFRHSDLKDALKTEMNETKNRNAREKYLWLAHELFPEDIFITAPLASYLVRANKEDALALRLLAQVADRDPSERSIFDLAHAVMEQGNPELGLKWLEYIERNIPVYDKRHIMSLKATAYSDMHRYDQALQTTNDILAEYPNDIVTLGIRSRALIGLRDFPAALADAQKMVELGPTDGYSYFGLARAYLSAGKPIECIAAADKALEYGADAISTLGVKSSALLQADRSQEALAIADERLALGGNENTEALKLRGRALLKLKQYPQALEAIESALAKTPDDLYCRAFRVETLIGMRRYDEALRAIEQYEAEDPEHFLSGYKAHALNSKGEYRREVQVLDERIKNGETQPYIFSMKAAAHIALGEYAEAIRTLDTQPDNPKADKEVQKRLLAKAAGLSGNIQRCKQELEGLITLSNSRYDIRNYLAALNLAEWKEPHEEQFIEALRARIGDAELKKIEEDAKSHGFEWQISSEDNEQELMSREMSNEVLNGLFDRGIDSKANKAAFGRGQR